MSKCLNIKILESSKDLKDLCTQLTRTKQKRIQMLLLIQRGTHRTKESLMRSLGASSQSVQNWRTNYNKCGLALLLSDKRKGTKRAAINGSVKVELSKRLTNSKEGFRSYVEVQQWLQEEFRITMKYQAINKYLKRNFGVKLKVARKSHINKSPAAEAVFKNTVR